MEVVISFTATTLFDVRNFFDGPTTPPLHRNQFGGFLGQYKPFTTLWFAATGKMLGGHVVNHQTITRKEALIAHPRSNSYFVTHENELGSIQQGKLAASWVVWIGTTSLFPQTRLRRSSR